MSEKRECVCGKAYWFPRQAWAHEACVSAVVVPRVTPVEEPAAAKRAMVVDAPAVVDMANAVVVDARSKDRHRKTAERREYLRVKQRESRARRAARRVSA